MAKKNISDILKMLHWSNTVTVQEYGIKCAETETDLSLFLQPTEDKGIWDNCARVLAKHSDIELSPYLHKLLEWCQDMNWPGAEIIYDRLLQMENTVYSNALSESIAIAENKKDNVWLTNLLNLQEKKAFWQERKS